MEKSLRIVFAGTPEFALPALSALIDSRHEVVAVYTQPDRAAGRGRQTRASPVKVLAADHEIPVEQAATLRVPSAQAVLGAYRPDAVVVAAYGLILPKGLLHLPPMGCINIHASLLPRWRGAAPIQRAILAGDSETGVTTMQMAAGLDTGDVLLRRVCQIGKEETAGELHDRLAAMGAEVLIETLDGLVSGHIRPQPQDPRLATYAVKLQKREAELDWTRNAELIARQVRAFNPWPVAYTSYRGEPLRIWFARALNEAPARAPGTVVRVGAEGIDVVAGEGTTVRVVELQLSGRRRMSAREFLAARDLLGIQFPDA